MMKLTLQCMLSPRLYKIYRDGHIDSLYQPYMLERWGDKVISTAGIMLQIGIYTSPFICTYIYKRGFYTLEDYRAFSRFIGGVGCLLAFSFLIRSIGRATNPKYVTFLKTLTETISDQKTYINSLRKYDFEFEAWPVSYSVATSDNSPPWHTKHPFNSCANSNLPVYQRTFIQVLAYLATHTFGLRLIYPGSVGLLQALLWSAMLQGRTQLVETYGGKRAKLVTADSNQIDTMFVDNRMQTSKGNILVISTEGNSGFYEIGIMNTPVKAGFSVLGWNHPGFGGSTGLPYPGQEENAIDAVMQYAINELGFDPDEIIMFGWSIGGYCSTWAAVNYPVKALILDATFDDLLPLAQNQMPTSWSLLVKEVIRTYVDLNVAELITQYEGPVQLVRRTDDEIICLRPGLLSSNRGNHLLLKLLLNRHSELVGQLAVESKASLDAYISLLETQRSALERTDVNEYDKRSLKLINQYMRDYKSSHCTPLPEQVFEAVVANVATDN